MKRFFLVLLFVFTLVATNASVNAQTFSHEDTLYLEIFQGMSHDEILHTVWVQTCRLNREQFPDSNLIPVGAEIKLPSGYSVIAGNLVSGGHQWRAAEWFTGRIVERYLYPKRV